MSCLLTKQAVTICVRFSMHCTTCVWYYIVIFIARFNVDIQKRRKKSLAFVLCEYAERNQWIEWATISTLVYAFLPCFSSCRCFAYCLFLSLLTYFFIILHFFCFIFSVFLFHFVLVLIFFCTFFSHCLF